MGGLIFKFEICATSCLGHEQFYVLQFCERFFFFTDELYVFTEIQACNLNNSFCFLNPFSDFVFMISFNFLKTSNLDKTVFICFLVAI